MKDGILIENLKDVEKHCLRLVGMKIGDIASSESLSVLKKQFEEKKYIDKNLINDIIEQDYFKIPKNSSPEPDIKMADGDDIELKVSHLWLFSPTKYKLVRPHYRLVLEMLDYYDVKENSNWRLSKLYRKLKKMLIVYYYQDMTKPPWEYKITNAFVFNSDDFEEEIKTDYYTIRNSILNGKKISERYTDFLANCPKHPGGFCWDCFDNSLQIRNTGKVQYKIEKNRLNTPCQNKYCSHYWKKEQGKNGLPRIINPKSVKIHPALGLAEKRGFCIPDKMMAVIWANQINCQIESVGRSYGVPIENISHLLND